MSLFFLFSVTGLAVDLGLCYLKRQQLQTAADAASQAAAMWANSNPGVCNIANPCSTYTCAGVSPATNSLQSGCLYAAVNGFTQGGNGGAQSVKMSGGTGSPAATSGLTTSNYWVQATVSETMPSLFLFWSGFRPSIVAANSTAAIANTLGYAANCIYVLNSTNYAQAFLANGSQSITGDCGIYVNSSNGAAFKVNGSNTIAVSKIQIVGGYSSNGSNSISPTPTTGSAVTPDPLGSLPDPVYSGICDHSNFALNSSGTANLTPGVYCGGITMNGSYTINFASGTYILKGGGFVANGSSTMNGTNVFFYNTGQNGTAGNVTLNGSQTLNFSAPSSGTYKGVLFFQDRAYSNPVNWNGSSSGTTGTLYFPKSVMTYNGSQSAAFQAVICDTLVLNGSSTLKKDTTGTYTGLAKTTVGLVE